MLKIICAAMIYFIASPLAAMAQETVVAPSSWLYTTWTIVQPIVVTLASIVGPALAVWLAAKVSKLLSVTDAAKQKDLEDKIRQALHDAALNGLKFAVTNAGIKGAIGSALTNPAIVDAAIDYIKGKSPDTAKASGATDEDLRDIVLSKVPDVKAIMTNVAK